MNLRPAFTAIASAAARLAGKRAVAVLVATGLIALICAFLAVRLEPQTGVETLTGSSSDTYKQTRAYAKQFGGDPIVILVRGDLPKIVLSPDIAQLAGLEGCISGNMPARELKNPETPRICKLFARKRYAKVVYGPGTFVNTAALSINGQVDAELKRAKRKSDQAAEAARKVAAARGLPPAEQEKLADQARELSGYGTVKQLLELSSRYGIGFNNRPRLDNPDFVARLIFDATRRYDQPKARFSYLFPNSRSAIIQVRLKDDLTPAQRREAIDAVRAATRDERFKLDNGKYTVTGAPVLIDGVEEAVGDAARILLVAALILMALTLLVVFPVELRLVPLVVALMAAAVTFGGMSLAGATLGVGAIAVLPILIGLAVDYAIQFQYRIDRERRSGDDDDDEEAEGAIERGARKAAIPVFTATFATLAALAALILSPVPLVRGFGALLAAGVVAAIVLVLTTGFSVLEWAGGDGSARSEREPAKRVAAWLRFRKVSDWLARHSRRALPAALVLAIVGWGLAAFHPVKTDVRELVSSNVQAVKDIETLQNVSGASGEVAVLVRAKDITDPAVLAWMRRYQQRVLADAGYKGERPNCDKAKLCPALSLTDLFAGQALNRKAVRSLLKTVPYYAQAIISEDRTVGSMAFGLRLQSLGDQKELIDSMRERLDPPKGVQADVVGLSVLAADASARLGSPWRRLLIPAVALVLVLLVMLAVLRSWRQALAPVAAVMIAGGLSALLLAVTRIELNPLSAALNVFVIAITTEFAALVYLQYLREREQDASLAVPVAYRAALRHTGPALFASAATALVGFATLAVSSISLLRGFALVAVIDIAAALAGALLVLPLITEWLEKRATAKDGAAD